MDNAHTTEILASEYNVVVLLEVLEHVEDDTRILDRIKSNSLLIFSVPNYDSDSHMRWFNSKDEIIERYGNLVDIKSIYELSFRPTQNKIYLAKGVKR